MSATRALKYMSRIVYFFGIFFCIVCFCETWREPFFLNGEYKILKFALCFIVPIVVCIANFLAEKSVEFMGKCTSLVCVLFVVGYVIDHFTVKFIACYGNFMIIYHLAYGLIASFCVFCVCTLIAKLSRSNDVGYSEFYNSYFVGFGIMLAFIFVLMYFVIRDYGADNTYSVNIIPFSGELAELFDSGLNMLVLLRTIGNVLFYTAMYLTVARFIKFKSLWGGVVVCSAISLVVEVGQYLLVCGDSDIDDFICNALGALLGMMIYKFFIGGINDVRNNRRNGC